MEERENNSEPPEVFEFMLKHSRDIKSEFESLEGLAIARFYTGDKARAIEILTFGIELAARTKRKKKFEKFEGLVTDWENGNPTFPKNIKAPSAAPLPRAKKRAHSSTLLKKDQ